MLRPIGTEFDITIGFNNYDTRQHGWYGGRWRVVKHVLDHAGVEREQIEMIESWYQPIIAYEPRPQDIAQVSTDVIARLGERISAGN